jgi:hypothetical protein
MTHPSRATVDPAGGTFSSQYHTPPANSLGLSSVESAKPIIPEILTTAFRFIQTLLHKAGEMIGLTKKID